MPIIIDELIANVTEPTPVSEPQRESAAVPVPDPVDVVRLLERLAERAARLSAD